MLDSTRPCPICLTSAENALPFLSENIDKTQLSGFSFASRKVPEYMCHKLVRCKVCDLVFASNPPQQNELAQEYHVAQYDSSEEAMDAAQSYIKAMRPMLNKLINRKRALDIGSGTGVLLELLKKEGFADLVGIEPSTAAIAAAPAYRRSWLHEGIFEEGMFEPSSFDLICCFMTLEHVLDPKKTALVARKLLRPGGVFVTVTHDYRSLVNRLLGKKSPIIDIEHMQLFSNNSVKKLFESCEFTNVSSVPFYNSYSMGYWIRLAPFPRSLKRFLQCFAKLTGMNKLKIKINVGNTITAGFRAVDNG